MDLKAVDNLQHDTNHRCGFMAEDTLQQTNYLAHALLQQHVLELIEKSLNGAGILQVDNFWNSRFVDMRTELPGDTEIADVRDAIVSAWYAYNEEGIGITTLWKGRQKWNVYLVCL